MKPINPVGTEVFTYTDKAKRDAAFREMRANGDRWERQAVKFSGNEPVLGEDGKQIVLTQLYLVSGAKNPRPQERPVFRSTWSIAHPKQAV